MTEPACIVKRYQYFVYQLYMVLFTAAIKPRKNEITVYFLEGFGIILICKKNSLTAHLKANVLHSEYFQSIFWLWKTAIHYEYIVSDIVAAERPKGASSNIIRI